MIGTALQRAVQQAACGLLTLLVLATGLVSPTLAASEDDRLAISRTKGTPMGAIGMVLRLDADGAEAGTGFLVSPCHVMTAAHVVDGSNGISENQVLLFFVGSGNLGPADMKSDYFGALSPARPLVWGDYKDSSKGSTAERVAAFRQSNWHDWALLKLDRCLGDDGFGHFDLLPMTTRDFTRAGGFRSVTAVGLPADRGNDRLTVDPACSLLGQVNAAGWQHDCTTMPGNSGGPVLAARPEPGEEWPRVLAITVASVGLPESVDGSLTPQVIDPTNPKYLDLLATAVPVSAFLPAIAPYLPEDSRVKAYLTRLQGDLAGNAAGNDTGYDVEAPQAAIDDLTAALAREPNNPLLLIRRGQWREAAKEETLALADYSAALSADPNSAPALRSRALLRAARDDKMLADAKAALADLDRLIARFPDLVDLRVERGGLRAAEYEYTEAIADFDAVLKAEPNNILALLSRANARMETGDFTGAEADYAAAIKAEPELAFIYVQRAHFHARAGDLKQAFADIDQALKIEPDMPSAINGRAVLYLHSGGADLALADANRAIELDPESGPGIALRGSIRQILGDLEGAIADFRKAGELDPKEPFDPLLLSLALSEAGRPAEARTELQNLLKRWPQDEWPGPLARHLLGQMSAADLAKRVDEGNATLRAYQTFDRHFYLGMTAYNAGDKARAREHLAAAVALDLSQFLEFDIARAYLERLGGPAYLNQTN
jgi:lipoprotein NlpI/V8-like Glu-specific endopeptidase